MKKLLFFLFVLLCYFQAKAQHRFQIGLEAGPKWTFTENVTGQMHNSTEKQIGYFGGIVLGYTLPGEIIAVETGLSRSSFDYKHNSKYGTHPYYPSEAYWPDGYTEPKLYVSTQIMQIPLRLKSRLFQTKNEKWSFWLTGGGVLTISDFNNDYTIGGNFERNDSVDYGIYISQPKDENSNYKEMNLSYFRYASPVIMIEAGLETHYKISDHFLISFKARHQSGLRSIFYSNLEDVEKSSRNGQYATRLNTCSNGSGVYLNIGLTYAFDKRNKTSE